jgi:hypothetical protein
MSIDRYTNWLTRHRIPHTNHGTWLELTYEQLAVVVTGTPPITPGAIEAACRRVTNPDLAILLETWGTPFGELIHSRDNRRSLGRFCWVWDKDGPQLRRVIDRT